MQKIYTLILVMSPQPVYQKGKRESNRQNKKKNERRYAGKNKMLHTTEWQVGKETIYQKCESNTIIDVMKIRLYMWNTKCNYKRNESDTTCPLCKTEEDTTEHIMVCQEGNNLYNLLDENEKDWGK